MTPWLTRVRIVCTNRVIVGVALAILCLIALNLALAFFGLFLMVAFAYPLPFLVALLLGVTVGGLRRVGRQHALLAGSLLTLGAYASLWIASVVMSVLGDVGWLLVPVTLVMLFGSAMVAASLVRLAISSLKQHR